MIPEKSGIIKIEPPHPKRGWGFLNFFSHKLLLEKSLKKKSKKVREIMRFSQVQNLQCQKVSV